MFIELTDRDGSKVLVNMDNVRVIDWSGQIHFNSGFSGSDRLNTKESYEEIKLKLKGLANE